SLSLHDITRYPPIEFANWMNPWNDDGANGESSAPPLLCDIYPEEIVRFTKDHIGRLRYLLFDRKIAIID
ncbi:MAG: hypothetical protein MHPSP_004895, partial [Paramarteilia canceri]